MKVISLFSGAGGLDLGLEAAGFDISICIENDQDAKQTLRHNRPQWRLMEPGDIRLLSSQEILHAARIKPREAYILSAGLPCQPFSKAAMWAACKTPGLKDKRIYTLKYLVKFISAALPKFVLVENVPAFLRPGKEGGYDYLKSGIKRINKQLNTNYRWSVLHLNAANYGVPQTRERVFLLADRDGREFSCPPPTHSNEPSALLKPFVTSWEAIGDLEDDIYEDDLNPKGKWKDLLSSIPEGNNYLWHTKEGRGLPLFGWRTKYWSFLLKLDRKRPSWTIPANPGPSTGPFHWKNRLLSRRELCRLQTFPDRYRIYGDYTSARRQIGNAVPPLIGEYLGRHILCQLTGKKFTNNRLLIQPRYQGDIHSLKIIEVPAKYISLIGNYASHPGPGKGPRAIRLLEEIGDISVKQ